MTGVDTDSGTVTLTATTGSITVANTAASNDIDASGDITLTALADEGVITVSASADVESSGGDITLIADDIDLAGTLTATAGASQTVTLRPETAIDADTIDLGTDGANANVFELTNADLQSVATDLLVIGSAAVGAITVSADVTPGGTALHLSSGSTVTATAGGIVETDLAVTAAGAVNFTDATTNVTTLAIDTSTGNVTFIEADGFSVGTVNGVTGVDTNSGTVALTATTGDITVSNTAAANDIEATGDITLTASADEATITVNGITAANSNNITGTVILNATADNASIAVSTAASTFNALTANADQGIAVNVALTTDVGALALDGDADNAADTGDTLTIGAGLTLTSAGSMTLDATTGGISGAGALTLNADNGVTLSAALTTAGNFAAEADNDSNASGNFTAVSINAGANTATINGVNVNTGSALIASIATLDGALLGNGVAVTTLVLTGASADMNGTVNSIGGTAAAALVTMPNAATHKFNSCTKTGCSAAAPAESSAAPASGDLDTIVGATTEFDARSCATAGGGGGIIDADAAAEPCAATGGATNTATTGPDADNLSENDTAPLMTGSTASR